MDQFIELQSANKNDVISTATNFAELYRIKNLFVHKVENNKTQFVISFKEKVDKELMCFAVNYFQYSEEDTDLERVRGHIQTGSNKTMFFIPDDDKEYDNCYTVDNKGNVEKNEFSMKKNFKLTNLGKLQKFESVNFKKTDLSLIEEINLDLSKRKVIEATNDKLNLRCTSCGGGLESFSFIMNQSASWCTKCGLRHDLNKKSKLIRIAFKCLPILFASTYFVFSLSFVPKMDSFFRGLITASIWLSFELFICPRLFKLFAQYELSEYKAEQNDEHVISRNLNSISHPDHQFYWLYLILFTIFWLFVLTILIIGGMFMVLSYFGVGK